MAETCRILRGHDWALQLRDHLPDPPLEILPWMEQHTQLLKSDTYSRVGLLRLRGQACFLKLYVAKSALQSLGFRLAYGRGIRSFDAACELAQAGIKVPAPRSCVQIREGILLLTEGVEDSCDLRALWLGEPAQETATRYLRQAGLALSALHHAGFVHGDCKWSNLLWAGDEFYLVDLEDARRVRAEREPPDSLHVRQLRDIARFTADAERLGASNDLYEAFLDEYCGSLQYSRDKLVSQLKQPVAVIRKRHESKSGNSFHALL